MVKILKSKVDYFDISKGDEVFIIEFVEANIEPRKDGNDIEQKLDLYKVVLPNTGKVHYLFTFEVEND